MSVPNAPDFGGPPPPPPMDGDAPVAGPAKTWREELAEREAAEKVIAAQREKERVAKLGADERARIERAKAQKVIDDAKIDAEKAAAEKRKADEAKKEVEEKKRAEEAIAAERKALTEEPAMARAITYNSQFRPITANIALLARAGFVLSTSNVALAKSHNDTDIIYFMSYIHPSLPGAPLLALRDKLFASSRASQHRSNSEWEVC